MQSIPHVDMSVFKTDFDKFVQSIGEGYEVNGFVALTHHGIPASTIHQALDATRDLFALPEDVKKQYHKAGWGGGARCYTFFGIKSGKAQQH